MSIQINVNGVSITLTSEQLAEIDNQRKKKSIHVTERIQTFDDIIAESGKHVSYFTDSTLAKHELGYRKFVAICEVYNEGWIPDFTDSDERKWYIYGTDYNKSSFGFSNTGYGYWFAHTIGGSRLCLKSQSLAEDVIKKFIKELNEFWN